MTRPHDSTATSAPGAAAWSERLALAVIGVGLFVLLGWAAGIETLKNVLPGLAQMRPNTALGLILCGISLFLSQESRPGRGSRRWAAISATAVMLLGVLSWLEYQANVDLVIDRVLFWNASHASVVVRMAKATAAIFALEGFALLLLARDRALRLSAALNGIAGLLALLALTGYLYDYRALYLVPSYGSIALHTALSFLALSWGHIFARPRAGLAGLLTSERLGGYVARRLLPAGIFVPLLLGWLSLVGQRMGLYPDLFDAILLVFSLIVVIGIIIVGTASALDRLDRERSQAEIYSRQLADIVQSSSDAIVGKTLTGVITSWNPGAQRLYGYGAEEVLGKPISLLIPLDHQDEVPDILRRIRNGEWIEHYETVRRRKDGILLPIALTVSPIKDSSGAIVGASAISRDITDKKMAEERFRLVVEAAPNAMVMVGQDGKMVLVNSQTEKLFGYSRTELIGQAIEILVPERFRRNHPGHRGSFFGSPETRSMGAGRDLFGLKKDGAEVPVEIGLNPIKTTEGAFVLASIIDITERKRTEAERLKTRDLEGENRRIVEASRLKSEFLANMSHELRTPLNGIIGFSELLHDGKTGAVNDQQKEFLGDILNSARHLLQLINDVLDLSKVEAGKMEFRHEAVLPEKVIGEVLDVLRTMISQKRIKLDSAVHPETARVISDPSKLKQVLYNYISNALKFTPDEGRVSVRVLPEGPDRFRLEVEDSGIGIKPEDQVRLFVEFQQLDSTMAKKHAGTGLGLALTKRIVEAQGGKVGLRSAVGKGSVFFAVLPKAPQPAAAPEIGPSSDSDASTVLVVDDNDTDRAWLVNKLTASGYAVEVVTNGEQAISRCKDRRFSAVLLDLILPDMNGWEVFKALRSSEQNKETPVIVVTIVADKNAGTAYAIQDYLVKPVSLETLKGALERAGISPRMSKGPILVVDDDPKALRIMREHLDGLGHRSILAESGANALKAAERETPSAVILDLMMPEMDGFEFLEKFRANAKGALTPVIIWTSKDLTREEASRLKLTTQALLRKEGSSRELIEQLRKILPLPAAPQTTKKNHGV